ncbi:GNAT family protein [Oceanobacillus sp. FSL K6-2867]|uniref:GNAT family N-acetyltransferase n=1 Tax=Oceanobacillus sp. FSL K6-2867 TaxID=2954748 RepID=UPI0030DCC5A4
MEILIEKLKATDADALFRFELDNRDYFEKTVPSRGDDYYKPEVFKSNHKALLEEQTRGNSHFYLIKDQYHVILGRINLVDIDAAQKETHLGYRVGKNYTGKGVAKKALQLLLENVADNQNIQQIHAKTTTNNVASRVILEKSGFAYIGSDEAMFEINSQKLTFVYYKWTNKNFSC